MRNRAWLSVTGAALVLAACVGAAASPTPSAVQFNAKGELLFPEDYRRWVFLTAGHGMSYNPQANAAADAPFDNVFADPASYDVFLKTGHWPEGTALLIDNRVGSTNGSINVHGAFQSGEPQAIELHIRDSKRFKGGWGFFVFEGKQPATLIDYKENCYSCHQQHAAVDTTFVQFYPTLLPIAAEKKSFSAAYLAAEKSTAK